MNSTFLVHVISLGCQKTEVSVEVTVLSCRDFSTHPRSVVAQGNLFFSLQVSVGVSVMLSLPVHAVVCLLILGCCPTGMLAPILAVLQQAHVELALVLSFLESTMAFGKLFTQ